MRSFSKTKVALVSLTFLIFLSIGIFSLLNNTTSNLKNSYDDLVLRGNLDDFVVNERYDFGPLRFQNDKNVNESTPDDAPRNQTYRISLTEDSRTALINFAAQENPQEYGFSNTANTLTNFTITQTDPNLTAKDFISQTSSNARNALLTKLQSDPAVKVGSVLNKEQVSFRQFNAIDITDGNIQKKLVESNPNDTIDRMVLYQGIQLGQTAADQFFEFQNLYNQTKAATDKVQAIENKALIPMFSDWLRTVQNNSTISSAFKNALTYAVAGKWNPVPNAQENAFIDELWNVFTGNGAQFTNNQWNYTVEWTENGVLPQNFQVLDPSSQGTVVAPGNFAVEQQRDGKEIYPDVNHWNEMLKMDSDSFRRAFAAIPERYKIKISSTEYLILGVGITPDFMYPVFNTTSLIPDPKSQSLYYVNSSGYARIRSAFLTNPIESNLIAKFPAKSSEQQKQNILNTVNEWARQYMSWPGTIKAAYLSTDQSNILNLNAARTTFIPSLISTITLASLLLTLIIVGLALFVGILIVKNYITKNRQNLAVLQSNGIKRWKINVSVLLFSAIPSLIGGIIGYLFGFGLQSVAVSIFSAYWFIPVPFTPFTVGIFFLSFLLPFLIFSAASLIVGWFVLRQNVVKSLKNDSDYKVSKFSVAMKMPLAKFGVITRFRASLAFNSFWKLVILASLSTATMVVFDFAISANGTFQLAEERTTKTHNYNYAIDLASPTEQSGLIKYQEFKDLGKTDPIPSNITPTERSYYLANARTMTNIPNWGWDNLQIPNGDDLTGQQNNIIYLKNVVQSQISLDYNIGFGGLSANPWTLSQSLMPANQASASAVAYQNFLQTIIDKSPASDKAEVDKYITQKTIPTGEVNAQGQALGRLELSINQNNVRSQSPANPSLFLSDEFLEFLKTQFDRIANGTYPPVDYKLTYNLIGLDAQTIGNAKGNGQSSPQYSYTRIEALDSNKQKLNIQGIKDWIPENGPVPENYLGPVLTGTNGSVINHQLFTSTLSNPLIINRFTARKYNLKVGSQIRLDITNSYDRVNQILHGTNNTPESAIFNVIGINDSAKDNELYTTYKAANEVLKYPKEMIDKGLPFNGFYSDSLLSFNQSTALFSESGLYPGTSSFATGSGGSSSGNSVMKTVIENTANQNPNSAGYQALLLALGMPSNGRLNSAQATAYQTILNNTYNGLPYNTMINFIYNTAANQGIFNSISSTSLTVQNIVIGIIVPIVVLIVILISNMLIDELRKIGIRLKALGYSNIKILLSFLSIYIPVFLIGLIVSIPISIAFVQAYDTIIFNAANIVLSSVVGPGTIVLSLLSLGLVFLFSFISNWISLHRLKIAQEIKNY
ncbi:ABC transporter permease [[Mycoplasma] testudinis]|uniref:ABC transporter permease n=1 Tax=[Mycoplasma] testudinis TaxID=33924 RepID=UPI00069776C4|nr:ABC transporter permease [[Mycoplasma] testudinis]